MSWILLRTACGCERTVNVGDEGWARQEIAVLLARPQPTVVRVVDNAIIDAGNNQLRLRRFRVSRLDPRVFEEVLE